MLIIAVLGTGNMGAPMSINLARAGHRVIAYDIVAEKTATLVQHGVVAATSHRDAVIESDIVLTMLPSGLEVSQVYTEEVFNHAPPRCVLIDSSTIDLDDARRIHAAAAQKGFAMLDAPVSGGTAGAAAGALTFMVGGEPSTLDSAMPALQAMAGRIIHCGQAGMGQAAKMCNNMMLGIQMASLAEGFQLARRVGLTDQKLYEVAASSSANCFSLNAFCPVPGVVDSCPANNQYRPGFSTDLMLKDMGLALNAAANAGLQVEMASAAAALYKSFSESGNGSLDFSAIFTMLENNTGKG